MAVDIDKLRTQQIIINLVSNAIKHSTSGQTVCIKISEANHLQDSQLSEIVIEVVDQGSGISEEDRSKVFEPYFRGNHSNNRECSHGLGLSTCKEIAT